MFYISKSCFPIISTFLELKHLSLLSTVYSRVVSFSDKLRYIYGGIYDGKFLHGRDLRCMSLDPSLNL